ncbi:hypothetical protein [Streptococcus salivarius]|uniref:hypothetical protein n=1 Tax=Streptococcus salivarius TaxID=1304 RepID=UPI00321A17A2
MITDNESFYLMTLKDFEKVAKKVEIFGLNGRPMLDVFRKYPPTCHDSNSLAYWYVPYWYLDDQKMRQTDFYKVMRWFLTNVIVGGLPDKDGSLLLKGQNYWYTKDNFSSKKP